METINDKLMQKICYSPDSERAILGGIFMKPDTFFEVLEIVKGDDFFHNGNKIIFKVMTDMFANNENIDPILLIEHLKECNQFEVIGGENFITEILDDTSTSANILVYANIVKEKSILRQLGNIGTKIVEMSFEAGTSPRAILDKAETLIFKISETESRQSIVNIKEALPIEYRRLKKVFDNQEEPVGIKTGFEKYDELTCGFQPGNLIVIAGRPAMGKTAFVLNIAHHATKTSSKNVLIFSMEMSNKEIFHRLLAIESDFSVSKIQHGFLNDNEWEKLGASCNNLMDSKMYISDTANINVMEIRAQARKHKSSGGLDLIIIDYLQLIGNDGKYENRQNEVSEISRGLKNLARELDIPVIALSQLSRAPEQRSSDEKRPILSDLRESGSIEQDADLVIFLYRDEYYHSDTQDKGLIEVIIGKHRNGPTGVVKLEFISESTKVRTPLILSTLPLEQKQIQSKLV